VLSVNEALVEEIRGRPPVVDLVLKHRPGDVIVPTHDLLTSPLRVFLTAADPAIVDKDYRCIESVRASVYEIQSSGPRVACSSV
jgi:hypothetical protein